LVPEFKGPFRDAERAALWYRSRRHACQLQMPDKAAELLYGFIHRAWQSRCCDALWLGSPLDGGARMDSYRIERAGTKYQVIEERPNRGMFQMVGFPTEQSARIWLDGFLREVRAAQADPADNILSRSD
jgi:hypothetical protein